MKETGKKKNQQQVVRIWVIVFGIVVISFLFGFYLWPNVNVSSPERIKGVLLDNGDVYFGKLSYFPRLVLSDAYTIQTVGDPENPDQIRYQVVPVTATVWAPKKIFLNYDKIVFIGDVGPDSQIMQIINQQ